MDDNIIYQARLHWIIFVWPTLLLLIVLGLSWQWPELQIIWAILGFCSIVWLLLVWGTYHFSWLTIKKKQVILCNGILIRQTIDIPLNKIESVDIRQTILGSLLQYGSLVITGTGGSRQAIDFLSKPLTCRRYIEQLSHE